MDLKQTDIWPFETGITDYPIDPVNLALPSIADIANRWAEARFEVGETDRLRTFIEQLNREWSIETGIIENLYDIERGVTQTLIEQGFQASLIPHGATNKDPEFVIALLNDQKAALEGLFAFVKQALQLTTSYIRELHAVTTRSQTSVEAIDSLGNQVSAPLLRGQWKQQPNYPSRDGIIYRYCPPEQVSGEMERLVEMHARHQEQGIAPEVEAAWLHHRFSQIHPFQDGNGRVARLLASLVLLRAGLFPMVVPREEKDIYIQTLELGDEGNLQPLVYLIARRQEAVFNRAMRAIERAAPDSGTLEEAARALRLSFEGLDANQQVRLKNRVLAFQNSLAGNLKRLAQSLNHEILGAGPNLPQITVRDPGVLPGVDLEMAKRIVLQRWHKIINGPCIAIRIEITAAHRFNFLVLAYATNPEVNETMQAVSLIGEFPDFQPMELMPLEWPSTLQPDSFNKEAEKWCREVLRMALGWTRRHL